MSDRGVKVVKKKKREISFSVKHVSNLSQVCKYIVRKTLQFAIAKKRF